jgi:hypothetical protein
MKQTKAILSTAYFPPIQYISKFLSFSTVEIEQFENYNKQSYRNRCIILSANGPLSLSIPVQKDFHPKIRISEIKLDYDTNWRKIHWKAIEAAYKRSPFFEFYLDDFYPFFTEKFEFLLPFNSAILDIILKRIGISAKIVYSRSYVEKNNEYEDFRDSIHPKPAKALKDCEFKQIYYQQVFFSKFGFVPNLSILDLLFNEGPNSLAILKNSILNQDL